MVIVHLTGHLGRDPETRFTSNGKKVTSFSLAVNQRKGKEEITTWFNISAWEGSFDNFLSCLKKGSAVIVTGRLQPPAPYIDKNQSPRVTLEVSLLNIDFVPGKSERLMEKQAQQPQSAEEPLAGGYVSHQPNYSSQYSPQQFQVDNSGKSHPVKPQSIYGSGTAQGEGQEYARSFEEDNLPF
jgi:single-strand DNA-binding protein